MKKILGNEVSLASTCKSMTICVQFFDFCNFFVHHFTFFYSLYIFCFFNAFEVIINFEKYILFCLFDTFSLGEYFHYIISHNN